MTIGVGTKLGRYEIRSKIGEGGMGEVYRAWDTELGREVAIKVLPPDFSRDSDRINRFRQEAQALARLNHPNILSILDVGSHDGTLFVVGELLEGETVRDRLSAESFSMRKALDYALQFAHGLAAAHAKGITHRDLKPENLFLTNDGRVKILDFGLAKLSPEPVILRQIKKGKHNLLVLGANAHPGEGVFFGHKVRVLLERVPCSLLLVRS